ncbi:MAG: hypothetical protein V4696_10240 [Pseudomonadota bacterium]
MAIATGTLIAAGIGAAASIGGAALSSSAQKKAANKASATEAQNSAANIALARENYANNSARLDPYSQTGMRAGGVLGDMLGIGPNTDGQYGGSGVGADGVDWVAYVNDPLNSDALADRNANQPGTSLSDYGKWHYTADGSRRSLEPYTRQLSPDNPRSIEGGTGIAPGGNGALSAFDTFRNSTNYQFRLNEGNKALNQGYAARGMLESGAAQKGIAEYSQNFAGNALGEYQQLLAQQQQVGLGAASALAGVGQNMTNSVMASNSAASSARANAALIGGQAQGQMYGSIAGALGSVASSFAPRSMVAPQQPYGGVLGNMFG